MEVFKILASTVMGIVGGYMMYRGKKIMNVKMMIWGGALVVLSYFAFSLGGDDKEASDALKKMIPVTTPGQAAPDPQQP